MVAAKNYFGFLGDLRKLQQRRKKSKPLQQEGKLLLSEHMSPK
jgi:hypothetical protein